MNWKRLKGIRNYGGSGGIHRAYGPDGEKWPRIVLAVCSYPADEDKTVRVSCSRKEGRGEWWQSSSVPKQLLGELIEILKEAESNDSV